MESSKQGKKFSAGFNAMEPLSDCVLCVTILDSNSRMYLCEPWDGLLMWANQVNDRHLPYIDTGLQAHFAGLNIRHRPQRYHHQCPRPDAGAADR